MREGYSYTYPPLSIARYSFVQLCELEQCRVKKLAQGFNTAARIRTRILVVESPKLYPWATALYSQSFKAVHVKGCLFLLATKSVTKNNMAPCLHCNVRTRDVSKRNLLPLSGLPMIMWKYVFPLLQLEIFVKGYDMRISCKHVLYYLA